MNNKMYRIWAIVMGLCAVLNIGAAVFDFLDKSWLAFGSHVFSSGVFVCLLVLAIHDATE